MAKNQHYLTYSDRLQIEFWLRRKRNAKQIAEHIGKDRSVVWRELNRNRGESIEYTADHAQYFSERRASKTNVRKLVKHPALHDHVVKQLNDQMD